ncbi:MAG: hypothetical protein ABII96_03405 [Candidatus Zixiibacteriota bacterium]
MEHDPSTGQDEKSSAASCPMIFYRDHSSGQESLFLKEKGAWNFQKWGEIGERLGIKKSRG